MKAWRMKWNTNQYQIFMYITLQSILRCRKIHKSREHKIFHQCKSWLLHFHAPITLQIHLHTFLLQNVKICHFATVVCNWFSVACDTCNRKFAQLHKTSCMRPTIFCNNTYMTSIYGWVMRFHPPIFYTNICKCDCMQLQGLRSH